MLASFVLEVYAEAYEAKSPVVGFAETSTPLVAEPRQPVAARAGTVERFDDDYARRGVRHVFMLCEPTPGWRHIAVTEQRTRPACARPMQWRVDEAFPEAARVRVVLETLNTPRAAALYETFVPAEARRLLRKLAFHSTPKHGSWLKIGEIALSVLGRQCLDRRIGDAETLKRAIKKLEEERHAACAKIAWRFTTGDARRKLHRLYPSTSD